MPFPLPFDVSALFIGCVAECLSWLCLMFQHYELMYAPFLARFYHTSFTMMEIGVEKGNSIQSWSRLFPSVKHVYGVG